MQQWNAKLLHEDSKAFLFRVEVPRSLWHRLAGTIPGLEIAVNLMPERGSLMLTEVQVAVRPVGCSKEQGAGLLNEFGPQLVASLRDYLQAAREQRSQHRLIWPHPLRVMAVETGLQLAPPIAGQGKDISPIGIGFFLPGQPPADHVYVNLAKSQSVASLALLAKIVRVNPCGNGWSEVGALFSAPADQRKR
jgi:hypothetical protein